MDTILSMVTSVGTGMVLALTALLMNLMAVILDLQFGILKWITQEGLGWGYTRNNPLIDVGWPLVRNFSNLLFVLALLYIGIMNALGKEDLRAQKMLPRLIGAAIMANFTPVIVGIIVDTANIITSFFLIDASGYASMVARMNSNIFDLQNALDFALDFRIQIREVVTGILGVATGFLLSLAVGILTFIFFMRYIAIWIITILGPLAAVSWAFQGTGAKAGGKGLSSFWSKWWSALLQWSFVGVTTSFFFYLSNVAFTYTDSMIESTTALGVVILGSASLGTMVIGWIPFVVGAGLTFVGLKMALDMSVVGANFALGFVQARVKQWGATLGRKASFGAGALAAYGSVVLPGKTAKRVGTRIVGQERAKKLRERWEGLKSGAGNAIEAVPLVGAPTKKLVQKAGEKVQAGIQKVDIGARFEDQQILKREMQKLKDSDTDALKAMVSRPVATIHQRTAAIKQLLRRGEPVEKLEPKHLQRMKKKGLLEDRDVRKIFSLNPNLAKDAALLSAGGLTLGKVASSIEDSKVAKKIDKDLLEKPEFARDLNPTAIKTILGSGKPEQVVYLLRGIKQDLRSLNQAQLSALLGRTDDAIDRLEKEEGDHVQEALRELREINQILSSPQFLFSGRRDPAKIYEWALKQNKELAEAIKRNVGRIYEQARQSNALSYTQEVMEETRVGGRVRGRIGGAKALRRTLVTTRDPNQVPSFEAVKDKPDIINVSLSPEEEFVYEGITIPPEKFNAILHAMAAEKVAKKE